MSMITLTDFEYHGIQVSQMEVESKADMTEKLAALDYMATRQAAPTPKAEGKDTEKVEDTKVEDTKASETKAAESKPKQTRSRKASTGKSTAAKKDEKKEEVLYWHHPESESVFFGPASEVEDDCVEVTESEYHKLKAQYEAPKEDPAPEEQDEPEYTMDDVKARFAAYLKEAGGPAAKALLYEYGQAGKVSELPEDEYPAIIKRLDAELEG